MNYDTWKLDNGEKDYFICDKCDEKYHEQYSSFMLDGKVYCEGCYERESVDGNNE